MKEKPKKAEKKEKKEEDEDPEPKKFVSSYMLFAQEHRKKVRNEHPGEQMRVE